MLANELPAVPSRQVASQAITAIVELWDARNGTFWRSTEHKTREMTARRRAFYPTVTFRCVSALLRAYHSRPELLTRDVTRLVESEIVPAVTRRSLTALSESTLNVPGEVMGNPFTLALCVETLERIASEPSLATSQIRGDAKARLVEAAESLRDLASRAIVHSNSHPFVLFHVIRGLRAAAPMLRRSRSVLRICGELTRGIRFAAERLLARAAAGSLVPSEAIALMFAAATLADSTDPDDRNYVHPSLQVSLDAQDANGCWPLGRVVRDDKSTGNARLEIVTHEVAWTLADTLLSMHAAGHAGPSQQLMNGLVKAILYATKSQVRVAFDESSVIGWSSDILYAEPLVESWTSAIVLEATMSTQLLEAIYNHNRALATFQVIDPRDGSWPHWLRWTRYRTDGEPDASAPILAYLESHIVTPIKAAKTQLPDAASRTMSVLLFGPPGTAKTTIVKGVADALGWPVVFLSPGTFIERGLEYIEASARDVFERILMLQRCIVMFDECDELFRDRGPSRQSEQLRTITAFVTASMLPKLQDLHDRGKVVFFICTNHFGSLDPAVKRGGRIDHILAVGPPDDVGRLRIVENALAAYKNVPGFTAAAREVVTVTSGFTRDELIRLCGHVRPPFRPIKSVRARMAALIGSFSSGRTISAEEFTQFLSDRNRYSFAVLEARDE